MTAAGTEPSTAEKPDEDRGRRVVFARSQTKSRRIRSETQVGRAEQGSDGPHRHAPSSFHGGRVSRADGISWRSSTDSRGSTREALCYLCQTLTEMQLGRLMRRLRDDRRSTTPQGGRSDTRAARLAQPDPSCDPTTRSLEAALTSRASVSRVEGAILQASARRQAPRQSLLVSPVQATGGGLWGGRDRSRATVRLILDLFRRPGENRPRGLA